MKSDIYKSIYEFPKHIKEALNNFDNNSNLNDDYSNIQSIMILGMGGSAITGLLISEILKQKIKQPIFINQNYEIPKWVNKNTLVIASSYSGNTEETLIACKKCIEKNGEHEWISEREEGLYGERFTFCKYCRVDIYDNTYLHY